jgi:hypothetical protein
MPDVVALTLVEMVERCYGAAEGIELRHLDEQGRRRA